MNFHIYANEILGLSDLEELDNAVSEKIILINYTSNVSELDMVLSHFTKSSNKDTDSNQQMLNYINRNIFGKTTKKKKEMEKLIVTNVIVTSVLTVARKFGYSCVYIFHIIYLEKLN